MTHASLFSGIGGAEIAASWMGWQNLFHCEINPFGRKVIEYWYPDSTSYENITTTDFTPWRGRIDVLTGGFPCQPFSVAGQRKGANDDRYLWPEMLRAIREIQPAWVVGENVAGILTMVQPGKEVEVGNGFALFNENHLYRTEQQYVIETVCQDLEREGYSVQPFVIPACAVGAPHRRDRVWIVAHRSDTRSESLQCGREDEVCTAGIASNSDEYRSMPRTAGEGTERSRRKHLTQPEEWENPSQRADGLHGLPRDASNPDSDELQRECFSREAEAERWKDENGRFKEYSSNNWATLPADRWSDFPTQSPVRSRDDGFPIPMDGITFSKWRQEAIKAYGNAWVPQVAYEIFRIINNVESNDKRSI